MCIRDRYIGAQSFTYTSREKEAERFLMDWFQKVPYFKEHPEYYGTYPIKGDPFDRAVCYGMVRGEGSGTVVFVHHNDVVDIEDFKLLKPYAFSPEKMCIRDRRRTGPAGWQNWQRSGTA